MFLIPGAVSTQKGHPPWNIVSRCGSCSRGVPMGVRHGGSSCILGTSSCLWFRHRRCHGCNGAEKDECWPSCPMAGSQRSGHNASGQRVTEDQWMTEEYNLWCEREVKAKCHSLVQKLIPDFVSRGGFMCCVIPFMKSANILEEHNCLFVWRWRWDILYSCATWSWGVSCRP